MVLPISGFLPVPLPMMIPFMGAQSLVIGKMFGEGFQYGKRKISAMTNEEFNKLTFEDMMSNARTELRNSIPTMNAALQDMKPMVDVVVREFLQYINEVSKTLQAVTVTGLEQGAHALGTHVPGAHPEVSIPTTQETFSTQQPFSPERPGFTKKPIRITTTRGVTQRNVRIKTLPRAGSAQIQLRNHLIQQVRTISRLPKRPATKRSLKSTQDRLTKLLGQYNWI